MLPRMTDWIGREPAAEAKKAGSASGDTLLTPRPPILIGRETCVHWSSVSDAFRIRSRPARSSSSKSPRRGGPWQGVLLSTCMNLGEPREYLKIRRASCLAISCSFSSAFPRSVTQMSRVEARDSADESGAPRSVADDGLTRMNCFRVFSLIYIYIYIILYIYI